MGHGLILGTRWLPLLIVGVTAVGSNETFVYYLLKSEIAVEKYLPIPALNRMRAAVVTTDSSQAVYPAKHDSYCRFPEVNTVIITNSGI